MVSVLMGTAGLAALVVFNFVECVRLAVSGTLLAFPHALDQKYLVLLAWGFLVPWSGDFPRVGCLPFSRLPGRARQCSALL